jgi:ABC-type amino acid transport substrate-binding protein
MLKSKKIISLLAAALVVLGVAGCGGKQEAKKETKPQTGKKMIVAINATFPPFESVKEGTKDYTGIDIEIAQYVAKKLGRTIEFSDMKFASLVPTLQSGRADMIISGISPTKERMEVVSFTKPYYFPMKALIFKKGKGYKSLADLAGKKAGASMGTTYVKELKAPGNIEVTELDNTPLVVQDIKNGRLDAGLFDSAQAAVFVKENPDLELSILNLPVVMDDTFAIALPKNSKDIDKVNDILKEMKQNGEMHKILVKYLGDAATKQYEAAEAKLDIAKQ